MTSEQLSELYTQINAYILQNFELFWAIMLGILAVIGVALYFIAKAVAEKGVRQSITEFETRIKTLEHELNTAKDEIILLSQPPQEYDLPLQSGVIPLPGYKCCYSKSSLGLVVVHLSVTTEDQKPFQGFGAAVAMLPYGFRPSTDIGITLSEKHKILVTANGSIIYESALTLTNLMCSFSFYGS